MLDEFRNIEKPGLSCIYYGVYNISDTEPEEIVDHGDLKEQYMWEGHQNWYALQFSLLAAITSGSALFATLLPVTVKVHIIPVTVES